jgi:hypothetical protein
MKIVRLRNIALSAFSGYLFVALFLVAFVPRLVYVSLQERGSGLILDGEMERAAASWASKSRIADVYGPGTGDSAHVAPLYPIFLGYIYRFFGPTTINAKVCQQILAVMASSAAIGLLPFIAVRLGLGLWCGIMAGVALALSPMYLWVETAGGWEQPYAALSLQGILLVFISLHQRAWLSWQLAVAGGILVGTSCLLCASVLPVVVLLLLAEVVSQRRNLRPLISPVLQLTGIAVLVILPWTCRNYLVLGGIVPIRSNWGLELAVGNHSQSNGRTYTTEVNDRTTPIRRIHSHPFSSEQERKKVMLLGELRYMAEKAEIAKQWIREHPWAFLKLTAQRFMLFCFPPPDMWPASSPVKGLKSALMTIAGACGLLGIIRLCMIRHPYSLILVSVLLGFSLPYMITHVDLRYRYPLNWLIFLLAFDLLLSGFRRYRLSGACRNLRQSAFLDKGSKLIIEES